MQGIPVPVRCPRLTCIGAALPPCLMGTGAARNKQLWSIPAGVPA